MTQIAVLLVIFGVVMRLLPHPANFAPILAIGLFAGTYLDRKYAFWLPIVIMLISDFFIGFYSTWVMLSVYLSFTVMIFVGRWIKSNKTVGNIFAGAIAGSVIFFIFTNLAVWLATNLYPHTFDGLLNCYIMAIPFFKNSLMGDILYVGILYGGYEAVQYFVKNPNVLSKLFNKSRI